MIKLGTKDFAGGLRLPQDKLDAKGLLAFHQQLASQPGTGYAVDHINAFLGAGAIFEVSHALELRRGMVGDEPFVGAVSIEIGCWDPATRERALELSREWLASHEAGPLKEYVTVRRDWLENEIHHMQNVDSKQAVARALPIIALIGAVLISGALVRALQTWAKSPPRSSG